MSFLSFQFPSTFFCRIRIICLSIPYQDNENLNEGIHTNHVRSINLSFLMYVWKIEKFCIIQRNLQAVYFIFTLKAFHLSAYNDLDNRIKESYRLLEILPWNEHDCRKTQTRMKKTHVSSIRSKSHSMNDLSFRMIFSTLKVLYRWKI